MNCFALISQLRFTVMPIFTGRDWVQQVQSDSRRVKKGATGTFGYSNVDKQP